MQKENPILTPAENEDASSDRTMSKNNPINESDNSTDDTIIYTDRENSPAETPSGDSENADFEELIKGPYKDAFTKKVQSIINKRFKEQKIAETKAANQNHEDKESQNNPTSPNEKQLPAEKGSSTYDDLIEAGIDPETAYRVLHLNEIMDSSMRYGAELAAKHLADSIRQKAARPHESALSGKGYSAKTSARSLTPEKRRELAKKALMGEQIGF